MTIDPAAFSGYASRLYEHVEDLAETADWAPRGKKQDAAVDRYLEGLHAICRLRGDREAERKAAARIFEAVAGPHADSHTGKAA